MVHVNIGLPLIFLEEKMFLVHSLVCVVWYSGTIHYFNTMMTMDEWYAFYRKWSKLYKKKQFWFFFKFNFWHFYPKSSCSYISAELINNNSQKLLQVFGGRGVLTKLEYSLFHKEHGMSPPVVAVVQKYTTDGYTN